MPSMLSYLVLRAPVGAGAAIVLLVLLIMPGLSCRLYGQDGAGPDNASDSLLLHHPERARWYIGQLGQGQLADTVYAVPDSSGGWRPGFIAWAVPTGLKSPDWPVARPRYTILRYPAWQGLVCSAALACIDTDTLADLMLYLHGKTPDARGILHDTSLAVAVVSGMARMVVPEQIWLTRQGQPLIMPVLTGRHLVSPRVRDLSGRISYLLQRPAVIPGRRDSLASPPRTAPGGMPDLSRRELPVDSQARAGLAGLIAGVRESFMVIRP